MEGMLLGSNVLHTVAVVGGSPGCSILGIINFTTPPVTLLAVVDTLLVVVVAVVAAIFFPFLATDITLVDLSAFF